MRVWAVVPVKRLAQAKSRLAPALSPEERAGVVLALLRCTLEVLLSVESLACVLVVSADPVVVAEAEACGARYLPEIDPPGLNRSLTQAAQIVCAEGGDAVLVVPGDLPRLTPAAVRALLVRAAEPPAVVIAPDRHGRGTNALLVAPPHVIPYSFGPNSYARHCALAQIAGVPLVVYRHPDLGFDLDVPGDLREVVGFWERS